jgi:hypothetical protein
MATPGSASQPSNANTGTQSISVSERQLYLIRTGLQEYLATLSHNEGHLIEEVRALLLELPKVGNPNDPVNTTLPDKAGKLTL